MNQETFPCLCLSTRQTASALTSHYDRAFAETGLSTTQVALMINIRRKGQTNITELAQAVKLDKSTLTRTLAPLIRQGHINAERGVSRRETILTLTEQGQRAMDVAVPTWEATQADLIAFLGGEEKAWEFVETLLKLQELKEK